MPTSRFDPGQDAFVLATFVLLIVMLAAGLTGAYGLFAYALVGLFGAFIGRGLLVRGAVATWAVTIVAVLVLLGSVAGMLGQETFVVRSVEDTVLGFHPATAYLVYGIWIPAFFTLGVGFALVFEHLERAGADESADQVRPGHGGTR